MYDLERAYGLGLIINALTSGTTKVFNRGLYYEIKDNGLDYQIERKKGEILSLVDKNLEAWEQVLLTTRGEDRKRKKKEKALEILKRKVENMLKYYDTISQFKEEPKELLTAPLELSAIKGIREEVKNRGYQGKQIKIAEEDWVTTIIGALHCVTWQYVGKGERVAIIPVPDEKNGVDVSHLRSIKEFLKMGSNRVSTITLIAHSAVKLYQELWQRRRTINPWMDGFTCFVYGSLEKTGNQHKAKSGGYFSLEIFEKLLEVDNGDAILEHFDYIFRMSARPGEEELAINFADFLLKPNIENYSKLLNVYLKNVLKRRIKSPKEAVWEEIMKYVKED